MVLMDPHDAAKGFLVTSKLNIRTLKFVQNSVNGEIIEGELLLVQTFIGDAQ